MRDRYRLTKQALGILAIWCTLSSLSYADLKVVRGAADDYLEITEPEYSLWKDGQLNGSKRCIWVIDRCFCITETVMGKDDGQHVALTTARKLDACPVDNLLRRLAGTWKERDKNAVGLITINANGTGTHKSNRGTQDEATWGNCSDIGTKEVNTIICDFNAVWKDPSKSKPLTYRGKVTVYWISDREIKTTWTVDRTPGQFGPPEYSPSGVLQDGGPRFYDRQP